MDKKPPTELIKMWRPPEFGALEFKYGVSIAQSFALHSHEEFQFGINFGGAGKLHLRGANQILPPGTLTAIPSGEIHRVCSVDEKHRNFLALYIAPVLLQHIASEVAEGDKGLPFFPFAVMQDKDITSVFLNLYKAFVGPASRLEQQSLLLEMMVQLLVRSAENRPTLQPLGWEHQPVKRVREYLEDNYAENISLEQIAYVASLSPFHLNRVFSQQVGLPPHAYQTQVRILRAKTLLAKGMPLGQVAFATGFASQSHFGFYFKRLVGVTPGQYVKNSKNFIDRDVGAEYILGLSSQLV